MDNNLTLIGQMITFAIFVWFTAFYVWPPIIAVMNARKEKIRKGIAAAEKGDELLKSAKDKSESLMLETKKEIKELIDKANQQAKIAIESGKLEALVEGDRLLKLKKNEIEQILHTAKKDVIKDLSSIVVYCTERAIITDGFSKKGGREKYFGRRK